MNTQLYTTIYCHHKIWGYTRSNPDSEALHKWSSITDLKLLYDQTNKIFSLCSMEHVYESRYIISLWLNTLLQHRFLIGISSKPTGNSFVQVTTRNMYDDLTGRKHVSPNPNTMSPNAVASCLLSNGKLKAVYEGSKSTTQRGMEPSIDRS